jgi:hypothetical protein
MRLETVHFFLIKYGFDFRAQLLFLLRQSDGIINKAEYVGWKLNRPGTAGDCGKFEPKKQWRKPPETTD